MTSGDKWWAACGSMYIPFFRFSFSNLRTKNEKRKTNSFFVFLTSLLKTKNEKGIRFSFFVRKFENEKRIRYPFFVRKFENEKGKNGIYTDPCARRG